MLPTKDGDTRTYRAQAVIHNRIPNAARQRQVRRLKASIFETLAENAAPGSFYTVRLAVKRTTDPAPFDEIDRIVMTLDVTLTPKVPVVGIAAEQMTAAQIVMVVGRVLARRWAKRLRLKWHDGFSFARWLVLGW